MAEKMKGAVLPGNSTVELREFDIPTPGHGEVLVRTRATTICGSDIRCIYREHTGKGAEGYIPGTICGHEPCGVIEKVGPGMRRFKAGDRVVVYHISGCGLCHDCRMGYMISCTSEKYRRAYGWQRNGGMAPYILAEEKDLVPLPSQLSYLDGAQVACGFGTTYEALEKIALSGNDALVVVGLGPVGLATLQLARAMGAGPLIGVELSPERTRLAQQLGLVDHAFAPEGALEQILALTGGNGVEKAVDTSASDPGRQLAIRATRPWGKVAFVGEGGTVQFAPSPDIIHGQKTIYGSWVTSIWRMEELVERIVRWGIHPDRLVTNTFPLERAGEAFALMAQGTSGKVAVVFE